MMNRLKSLEYNLGNTVLYTHTHIKIDNNSLMSKYLGKKVVDLLYNEEKEKIIKLLNEFKTKPVKVSFVATKIKSKPIKVHKFADRKELERYANKILRLFV